MSSMIQHGHPVAGGYFGGVYEIGDGLMPDVGHIHLPSVHVRADGSGFDYDQDLYSYPGRIERVVSLVVIEHGRPVLARETFDVLCPDDVADLEADLPALMDEANTEAREAMELIAREEFARQLRIARGAEAACGGCGCSETRACSGGCVWVNERRCSRCV
jgi:hypothetical protein